MSDSDRATMRRQCPDCGEWFDTWADKPEVRCPACIEERSAYLRHYRRSQYAQRETKRIEQ